MDNSAKSTDMLMGSIFKSILLFSIPLLIGNLFQQLYNTVDSYVVGNYVNTSALAAVGASASVINMLVGFFMGLSAGAGVVISQYYGAKCWEEMSDAVHSALALTGILGLFFTIIGILLTRPLLRSIGVPEDVLPHSTLYLTIYFGGIIFSLIYNIGSGILRAIGDSKNPLIYLIVASLVNIGLDFIFVCGFGLGIAGVAIATVIAQAVSSVMVMYKLMTAKDAYRVNIKKIRFHSKITQQIISVGLPTALQLSITSFSNVIVQSYINHFGTAAIAAYSTTLRIDAFLQMILQSFNMTITTFVGQNIGAGHFKRVKRGIFTSWLMCTIIIAIGTIFVNLEAETLIKIFTDDSAVITNGAQMLRIFSTMYLILPVLQILNGALRGAGLSKVPMYFMLGTLVLLRQIYLMIAVPYTDNLMVVMAAWPITWCICAVGMAIYFVKVDWLHEKKVS